MANISARKKVAKQVHSILLDYLHSIAIFRERAREFCAEYQRYFDTIERVNPAEATEEEFNNPDTMPDDIDEMALKTIPRDPIRGSEYYKEPATKREELSEQYTALAVLHDVELRKTLQSSVIILTDKSWACLMVQKSILGNKADYDEKFYQDALEAVTADLASKQQAGQKPTAASGGKKITKEEANVRARELIRENPNYTIRKLAEKIPCSTGLVSQLPAWKALQEYKKKMFGNRRPKVIPLTKELEACLGSKDEQIQQLTADQEKDQRQDTRQARLYLSQKKPDYGRP
jgi:hypothetical protein